MAIDPSVVLRGERGYAMLAAEKDTPPTIYLYSEILPAGMAEFFGGVSAKAVLADLKAAEGAPTIAVRINSPGGDVFEGIAIYNALARFPGEVHVHVDGMAASIASLIMLAGTKTTIAENGMVMVHRAWTYAAGDAPALRSIADTLDKGWAAMLKTYQGRTGKRPQSIEKAINDGGGEWWMTADEAVSAGFADATEKTSAKAAVYGLQNFKRVPERLAAAMEKGPAPAPVPTALAIESARVVREPEALPAPPPDIELEFLAGDFVGPPALARNGGLPSATSAATKP